jgi:hypothetical protein
MCGNFVIRPAYTPLLTATYSINMSFETPVITHADMFAFKKLSIPK